MENQWKSHDPSNLGGTRFIPYPQGHPLVVLSTQDRSDSLKSWDKKSRLGDREKWENTVVDQKLALRPVSCFNLI